LKNVRASQSAGLPQQGPTTPSFWLVADPEANPLARIGAEDPLPEEDVDIVVIGSGITGVSFLLNIVQDLVKNPAVAGQVATDGVKIVMLEARDFCEYQILPILGI
jgi:NADH dehydrogenase FAD-containing subunit